MRNQGQFKVWSFVSLVHFRSVLHFLKRWKAASASVAFIHQVHSIRCWWHTRVSSRIGFSQWIHSFVWDLMGVYQDTIYWAVSAWWTCLCTRRFTLTALNPNTLLASKGASVGRTAGGNHSCLHQISQWRCESNRDISSNAKRKKLWIWHEWWRRILCGLGVSVQHFMAIHQSNKWDISTLNRVLHQPGIKSLHALDLAPNRSGACVKHVHVCLVWPKASGRKTFIVWPSTGENILAELQWLFEVCCVSFTVSPLNPTKWSSHRCRDVYMCEFDQVWRGHLELDTAKDDIKWQQISD